MLAKTEEYMASQVADWHHRGLISASQADTLAAQYDRKGVIFSMLLKWLGFFAIFILCLAVLSFIAMMSESLFFGALILAAAATGIWFLGVHLITRPDEPHMATGGILITVGLMSVFGVLMLLYQASGGDDIGRIFPFFLFFTALPCFATAYRFRLRWPQILGLLFVFHGLGSWHAYGGSGNYFADIQDPKVMAVISLMIIVFGVIHERIIEETTLPQHTGFGRFYIIIGLVYFNCSLWFLTIPGGDLFYVLLFAAAAMGELIAGSRLKDGAFTGFGIVFLAINIYTRFFEHFWDSLSAGIFFAVAGTAAIAAGAAMEWLACREHHNAAELEEKTI